MVSVREIMTGSAECARTTDTLVDAAKKMRDLDVGALPICGDDDRLHGMITDRDIVIRCIADGGDPNTSHSRTTAARNLSHWSLAVSLARRLLVLSAQQPRRARGVHGRRMSPTPPEPSSRDWGLR